MRISATLIVILILTYVVSASVLDPVIENVVHLQASKPPKGVGGMWKKKTLWKPRWIKEWKSAKVMKPVWKKIWSPVQIREWVPIPKPPPGWDSISTPLTLIDPKPRTPMQDSAGYDSFLGQAANNIPLWDPVPYPQSQQPPPPPVYSGSTHSATFNEEQISGIIGAKYKTHDYSPEYSETVNHLTRLPASNNWRPPQRLPYFQNFPTISEFLIPPQYQTLVENNPGLHEQQNKPLVEVQKSFGKWIPLPPENKAKTPDASYVFQLPEILIKNGTDKSPPAADTTEGKKLNFRTFNVSDSFRHHSNGDLIQEAQLVGEFHYSEFDLTTKPEQVKEVKNKPSQQNERIVAFNKEADNKPRQLRKEVKFETTTPKLIPKEIYPMYENPNLFFIPPNHRFAPLDKINSKQKSNETTTKLYSTAPMQSAPEQIFYKNASLQIVYPTAPQTAPDAFHKTYSYNTTAEDSLTTTEKPSTPFSIIFPSSLGEEVTKSPVFVVTPAKTGTS